MMRVVEIFDSIDGEGIRAGELATFIRLAGCNVRCTYCDTPYALSASDGRDMTIEQIIDRVKKIGNVNVTLTGGEPLIHPDAYELVSKLEANGYRVNIETNGTVSVKKYELDNVVVTMDYKTVSSGVNARMLMENVTDLREQDVLKIVCEEKDFPDIRKMLSEYKPKAMVYLSPIFGKIAPVQLVEFMKKLRDDGVISERVRVQLQLHKIIWNPEQKGV